ncbi:stage V sporulation protein B [Peribacillus kribbensis]|uniref:stage V sporulation protein B n=1 Tax=Peribacillus kribbensis TaxID=356658 RepID=UPI00047D1E42|nr:stage V sporulation protein B [Peribacillus kribbensis]
MSKFLRGTMILLAAGLVTRILGFVNRIVVARSIGGEGVGLFMMAFPTLILVISIIQLGLPVAISKCVAEALSKNDEKKVKRILVVSLSTTLGLAFLFTPLLILCSPLLSSYVFTDKRIIYPLLAMTPVIPIVAVSSVLRGYFQGRQNMKPAAYSQVIEQVVRITLVAFLTAKFLPYGVEYAAAAAMAANVAGELISLFYLLTMFKMKKHFRFRKNFFKSVKTGRSTFNELMEVALPTTGGRLIGSISWFAEPIVVSQSLAMAGVASTLATKQYGELTGFALPLLMLPSFVTFSLSTALIPAISEAHYTGNMRLVEHRLQQALRLSFITGALSAVVLYVLADPLMEALYGTSNAAVFIKFLAPFFIFSYYQAPLQAALQAMNLAKAAMYNSLIGAIMKTAIIFIFASRENIGIMGAAAGIAVGTVLVTMLHYATIMKKINMSIHVRPYLFTFIAMAPTGAAGYYAYHSLLVQLPSALQLIVSILIMTAIFIIFVFTFNLITKEETKRISLLFFR